MPGWANQANGLLDEKSSVTVPTQPENAYGESERLGLIDYLNMTAATFF